MSLVYSVPGKTFLAGEYLAVKEAPTLFILSKPVFDTVISKGEGTVEGIHSDSPAGLFIEKNKELFKDVNVRFKTAYDGKGGFGASTAQFLAVYSFVQGSSDIDPLDMLEDYYEVAWQGVGTKPSGADLVAQLCGQITYFHKKLNALDVHEWPFKDIEVSLIHTGNKVATHEHLKTLGDFSTQKLEQAFKMTYQGFTSKDSDLFCEGINQYQTALQENYFTCEQTLELLAQIRLLSGVKATKGCGALGADVIVVVNEKNKMKDLEKFCQTKKLALFANSKNISDGLTARGSL